MTSEIRVNKIINRAGLGTVTYTDTGMVISGVSSASNFKTGSSNLHSTGLTVGDTFLHSTGVNGSSADIDDFISVGSNIHLGNAGVITATSFSGSGASLTGINADLVNDSSPQLGGDLDTNGHEISLDDDHKIKFGASSDLQIYHSASAGNSFIDDNGSGNLRIRTVNGNGIELIYGTGTLNLKTHYNGGVDLHYTGTKRFETTSSGVTISGNANFANNNKAIFGTGNDAEIYHNDTDFHIDAQGSGATRGIYITAGTVSSPFIELRTNNGESMLKCLPDDGVFLYHNNNLKLRTTSAGTEFRGDVHFDNHTNTGKDILFDESANSLIFNDNVKSSFGSDSDLQIFNTGSESHIKNINNQGLIFSTNNGERWGIEGGGHLKPHANNAYDLGHTSYKIRNVYATTLYGDGSNLTGVSAFVSGMIMLWSGAANAIPSGWYLCNGSNGTPDLRGRFVVGYHDGNGDYDVNDTGGAESVTLSTSQIPSHDHAFSGSGSSSHSHSFTVNNEYSQLFHPKQSMIARGENKSGTESYGTSSATVSLSISGTTNSAGSGGSHENRPPYYALCYIMKS